VFSKDHWNSSASAKAFEGLTPKSQIAYRFYQPNTITLLAACPFRFQYLLDNFVRYAVTLLRYESARASRNLTGTGTIPSAY